MSSVDNSRDALTIQQIIASIPDLINLVSVAKSSIPLPLKLNTDYTITTTTFEAAAVTTTTSNVNANNIGSITTTSISTPGNSNNTAAATATATSTSGPAPSPASTLDSGSGSGSTSTTTTTEGGSNSDGNTTTSNNANIEDVISDGSCCMLGFSSNNPSDENKKKDKNITADVGNDGSVSSEGESNQKLHNQLEKLTRDLYYVQSACDKLKHLELHVGNQFKSLQRQGVFLQSVLRNLERVRNGTTSNHAILTKQMQLNIKLIAGMVMELKYHIPSPYKLNLANEVLKSQNVSGGDSLNLIDEILKIRGNKAFEGCSSFVDFKERYNSLDLRDKLCLLCFSVFPENSVVKKRLLMYWWLGEGFIDPKVDADKPEEVADGILKKFLEKGFVEPEIKKRRLVGFRMHSLIRYAVIFVAEKVGFFHFDSMGNPTGNFSTSQRACLIKTGEKYSRQALLDLESKPETLHALFNVNDPYPDLNTEWFSRMRNINVLCLGRWENSSKKNNEAEETKHDVEVESTEFLKGLRQQHHVEVESTEFLKGLRNMKHLKFLSLQGISRINELPETIQKLVNLKILDLNSCHNLEAIPENIVSLQKLTHLDISECYMLDYMPKGLGSLIELQVLKGFVISNLKIKNAGTLDDLRGLPKLRKLSIYTTKKDFPRVQDLKALRHITALQKLTIEWGGKSRGKKEEIRNDSRGLTRSNAFGPFGFLDAFDPSFTPNTTDLPGRRYSFANQPDIGLWNIAQFTATLSTAKLINDKEADYAMERYGNKFMDEYQAMMTRKLGLPKYNKQLINKLLNNMAVDKVDYTNFFRLLSNVKADPKIPEDELLVPLKAVLLDIGQERKEAWISWVQSYVHELAASGISDEQRKAQMNSVNPKYVLRNYLCQTAIDAAEQGDYTEVRRLLKLMKRPYDEQPGMEKYARLPPAWAYRPGVCMLSCSS